MLPNSMYSSLRSTHKTIVFGRAIRKFIKDPEKSTYINSPVLSDLIYGWGNEWSAMHEYLVACIEHAMTTDGHILECGSGLSTILVSAAAQKKGNKIWTLEHIPEWGNKVTKHLEVLKLTSATMCISPIKSYGDFSWYAPRAELIPEIFSLVICDGPPGGTPGGRYGLVPVMKKKLGPGTVILLDDGGRIEEQEIAKRWKSELCSSFQTVGNDKPYIKMTIGPEISET